MDPACSVTEVAGCYSQAKYYNNHYWIDYMITVRFLHPLLKKDGKKYSVGIDVWAKTKLSPERYQEFESDLTTFQAYQDEQVQLNRLIQLPNPTETFTTSDGSSIIIDVGYLYQIVPDFVYHPKFEYWLQCMSEDPDIIYYPREIIG